jgi:hypothetical protein
MVTPGTQPEEDFKRYTIIVMKRVLYILITLLIVVIAALVYLNSVSDSGTQSGDEWTTFPESAGNIPNPQSATFDLKGENGVIEVRNFFTDQLTRTDPVNEGHYQLGTYIDPYSPLPSDEPYYIEYIASTEYFNISLLAVPIAGSRREAEQFLLNHLDISEDQLCNINYRVTVPARVNLLYAGQSLGFSFCPNAVAL